MYRIFVDSVLFCDSQVDELMIMNPVIDLAVNTAGSFNFTIPNSHPFYETIKKRKSIISVFIDKDTNPAFQGIATYESIDFWKNKSFKCEGELTYLNDSILRPAYRQGVTVLELLTQYISEHNAQVEQSKQFEIGYVTVTDPNNYISCYTNMNSTFKEIKEDLIDDLGGYLRVRYSNGHKYIDYLKESTKISNQTIELGLNLIDYKSNIDDTQIATRIIPLGKQNEEQTIEGLDTRLTIESVNNGIDYLEDISAINEFGIITKTVEFDIESPQILKTKGLKYLQETQFEDVYIETTAVDLGRLTNKYKSFELLDSIKVVSKRHGMNRFFTLTKRQLNLNEPEKDKFVFGKTEKKSLSVKTVKDNEQIKKQINNLPTSSYLKQQINQSTSLITGAEGGNVMMHIDSDTKKPYEILIMNGNSIDTSNKIWRWNQNGFGYSKNGYNGPFETAITMDGSIVANFITSGVLSGDRIRGGELEIGGNGYGKDGSLVVKDQNNEELIKLDKNGITISDSQKGVFTQITKDTITTEYINALGITAGSVACENLTGTTISGKRLESNSDITSISISNGVLRGNYRNESTGVVTDEIGRLSMNETVNNKRQFMIRGNSFSLASGGFYVAESKESSTWYQGETTSALGVWVVINGNDFGRWMMRFCNGLYIGGYNY